MVIAGLKQEVGGWKSVVSGISTKVLLKAEADSDCEAVAVAILPFQPFAKGRGRCEGDLLSWAGGK